VHINYLDIEGQSQKIEATGLLATCLQHEIDQLNGIMFIEHLSKLKRNMLLKKFYKRA
jgi:peptide deformylase